MAPANRDADLQLICSANGQLYGLDACRVRHIGVLGQVWKLPLLPDYLTGVTRIGGSLIPVIDLRRRLGLPAGGNHSRRCVVEVDSPASAAIAVDSVERVSMVEASDWSPQTWASRFAGVPYAGGISGVAFVGDRLCLILDIDWIVTGASAGSRTEVALRGISPVDARQALDERGTPASGVGGAGVECPEAAAATTNPSHRVSMADRVEGQKAMAAGQSGQPPSEQLGPDDHPYMLPFADKSPEARLEHLAMLLAKPVFAGMRRIPGFRRGHPRLPALAAGLLQMPATFKTGEAALAVAALMGSSGGEYRVSHFRYDLGKLRARHLAQRIGVTRTYRLTRIGRIVCQALTHGRSANGMADYRAA